MVILIAIFVFQVGYQAHIQNFFSETKTLYTLGVSFKSIAGFLIWSLTLEYLLSYVCAVLIALGSMKWLFARFLEVSSQGYSWLLFHVNGRHILLLGGVWYLLLTLICLLYMRKLKRHLLSTAKARPRRRVKALTACGILRVPYEFVWARCSGLVKHGIALSICVCSIAFFLLNYVSINAETIKTSSKASFLITKNVIENGAPVGFTAEEISDVNQIEGIEAIFSSVASTSSYLVAQPMPNAKNIIYSDSGVAYVATSIKRLPDQGRTAAVSDPAYIPVWLNPYQPGLKYSVGDLIDLYVYRPSMSVAQSAEGFSPVLPSFAEKMQLQVAGYVEAEYLDGPLQLYFEAPMYDALLQGFHSTHAEITLREGDETAQAARDKIYSLFNGKGGYELIDLKERDAISARTSQGLYWMAAILILCFSLLTTIVVAILLEEFMTQQRFSNDVFFLLGLSPAHLLGVYRRVGLSAFLWAAGLSLLIGGALTGIFFANTGYAFTLTLPNAIIYAAMLLSLYFVMDRPMRQALRKQLHQTKIGGSL